MDVDQARGGEQMGGRFTVVRRLGEGGMGVVYEALDCERSARVALKKVHHLDATALQRFKNEFRALADVTHPNLVALHDLVSTADETFFTMELVEGVHFLDHVGARGGLAHASTLLALGRGDAPDGPAAPEGAPEGGLDAPVGSIACDAGRLRDALIQLVHGVSALHAAGKLHRDLKPSNVMVTPGGRVVILDFGLVVDLDGGSRATLGWQAAGTPEYMAPEQASGEALSEASDWYSVGVILFEALTGRLPHVSRGLKLLVEKQTADAPRVRTVVTGVPADLADLADELLRRDPAARPRGSDLLARLDAPRSSTARPQLSLPSLRTADAPLLGREAHLAELRAAFEAVRKGSAAIAHVHGSSGMGKSILVRRFLDGLGGGENAVVLAGRCYEREQIPYKALDAVVDALSVRLRKLPRQDVLALLPRDVMALARIFPVLLRVEAVATARGRAESPDPHELRRRAFSAFRELVARFTDRRPLVIWINDLEWGDADSAGLLAELLRPPEPPPLLLVVSYTTEAAAESPVLPVLRAAHRREHDPVAEREIEVGPLTREQSRDLARSLLGGERPAPPSLVKVIAEESGGSPVFIEELARHALTAESPDGVSVARGMRLAEVLRDRARALPDPARRLLEVVSVAGRPLEREVAAAAAELSAEEERTALALLRAGHFVRSLRGRSREELETFHGRIRAAIIEHLDAGSVTAWHGRIALALEMSQRADPEALAMHFRAAGEHARAAEHERAAAERAAAALAFDRAASLYRRALESVTAAGRAPDAADLRALRWNLADALANAGRGVDAAGEYLAAARGARAADALELQRRAAEELLKSGHVDEGVKAMQAVLSLVGMTLPASPRWALLRVVFLSLYLRARRYRFTERDASQVSPEDLTRIDVCWSVTVGLGVVDTIRSAEYQKRQIVLALRAGELYRVARAVTAEASHTATVGGPAAKRTARLVALAADLAERSGNPHACALVTLVRGVSAFLEGRWVDTHEHCGRAEARLLESCSGAWWEIANARIFQLWGLSYTGDLAELSRRLPQFLADAHERGDLYLMANLSIGRVNLLWLAGDDPDRAAREVNETMARWSMRHVHLQHYYAMLALAHADLYAGNGRQALERVDALWERLRAVLIFRIQTVRIEALHLRARALLRASASSPGGGALVRRALADAGRIERERMPWAPPPPPLTRPAAEPRRGGGEAAAALLERAATVLDRSQMQLHAAAARRRRGQLLGDAAGRELVARADEYFASHQVKDPGRMTELLAPGFLGVSST